MNNETFETTHGDLTAVGIVDTLSYISYKKHRDEGLSHESLISIGLGNDVFKCKYETEKAK